MAMASIHGNFLPCMIISKSNKYPEGYYVYFFHIQEEMDVPAKTIFGNLKALMHCEVSFLNEKGRLSTGYVRGTDSRSQKPGGPLNFFICNTATKQYQWVSFPFIFLTQKQARVLCC